jgi:hypothetical protein
MAAFTQSGRTHPGSKTAITVNGGASAVALTDTLTLHGKTLTILEWVRRGVLRPGATAGNAQDYLITSNPESA